MEGQSEMTSIAQTTDESTTTAEQAAIRAMIDGYRALADFVEANPELAPHFRWIGHHVAIPVDSADEIAEFARAAARAKWKVRKYFDSGDWAGIKVAFGPVVLDVYAARNQVCERVVTGTREVTEEVPDPEALAAVPTTTVTRTEEIVEWRCTPLLDGASS